MPDRWKLSMTGLLLALAVVGAGLMLGRRPLDQPLTVPPAALTPAARTIAVHVTGAVAHPGLYALEDGLRAADAIARAGGPTEGADLSRLNLATRLRDGQQIVVPLTGAIGTAPAGTQAPRTRPTVAVRTAAPRPEGKVNLNLASVADLEALPGIGPATARKIVAHREQQGPFATPDDLRRARLIPAATWERIKDLIEVP